jgi:hypothetical protein
LIKNNSADIGLIFPLRIKEKVMQKKVKHLMSLPMPIEPYQF